MLLTLKPQHGWELALQVLLQVKAAGFSEIPLLLLWRLQCTSEPAC